MSPPRPRAVHYLRTIQGGRGTWVHCGRALATVAATRQLDAVTCVVCARYIARGRAYGYASDEETRL